MQGKRNGGGRRSAAEWREILERYEGSGLSQAAFCQEAGVAPSTFQVWRRKLRRRGGVEEFVALSPSVEPGGRWAVEIELPDGTVTRVRG
jgi:transposase-like protein